MPWSCKSVFHQEKGKLENVAFRNPDGTMVLLKLIRGRKIPRLKW
ncbi:glycoside hydrolase family 30 beta sandwich domain-containing protein [Paenibacillus maysiensis]